MNMAVSGAVGRGHAAHGRPANFGQLNSAIARGDLAAAQNAFTAITQSTAPAAMAVKARGSLETVGAAIASGDLEAAKKSLADFRNGQVAQTEPVAGEATNPAAAAESESSPPPAGPSTTEQIAALLSGQGSLIEISA